MLSGALSRPSVGMAGSDRLSNIDRYSSGKNYSYGHCTGPGLLYRTFYILTGNCPQTTPKMARSILLGILSIATQVSRKRGRSWGGLIRNELVEMGLRDSLRETAPREYTASLRVST